MLTSITELSYAIWVLNRSYLGSARNLLVANISEMHVLVKRVTPWCFAHVLQLTNTSGNHLLVEFTPVQTYDSPATADVGSPFAQNSPAHVYLAIMRKQIVVCCQLPLSLQTLDLESETFRTHGVVKLL